MDLKNGYAFQTTLVGLGHVGDTGRAQRKRRKSVKKQEGYKLTASGIVLKKQENTRTSKEGGQSIKINQKIPLSGSCDEEVNHPPHYASGEIECIDAMKAMADQFSSNRSRKIDLTAHQCYQWQVIFKYIWRFPFKQNPLADLKKAEFYLKKLIKDLE